MRQWRTECLPVGIYCMPCSARPLRSPHRLRTCNRPQCASALGQAVWYLCLAMLQLWGGVPSEHAVCSLSTSSNVSHAHYSMNLEAPAAHCCRRSTFKLTAQHADAAISRPYAPAVHVLTAGALPSGLAILLTCLIPSCQAPCIARSLPQTFQLPSVMTIPCKAPRLSPTRLNRCFLRLPLCYTSTQQPKLIPRQLCPAALSGCHHCHAMHPPSTQTPPRWPPAPPAATAAGAATWVQRC
jgi:hypothetical protein